MTAYTTFGPGAFPDTRSTAGRVLDQVARRHEATARQIALAFLTRHAQVFPIPKASSVAHVEENAGAGTLTLSRDSIDELEAAFPARPWTGRLPMI